MLHRVAAKSVAPVSRAALRMPMRGMSVCSPRMQDASGEKLPRGTVVPGSKVDPQLGDYPAMPFENQQFRPFSRNWWDTQDRRNFGETLHEQDDVLSMWSPDAYKTPGPVALRAFSTAVALIALSSLGIYVTQPQRPAMQKTFPRNGLAEELGGEGAKAPVPSDEDAEEGAEAADEE